MKKHKFSGQRGPSVQTLASAFIGVGAIFTHSEAGGALRRRVGIAQRKPIAIFPSAKAGRSMPCEAMHQRDLLWTWEADSDVVDYASEPLRIDLFTNKGKMTYFPDAIRLKSDCSLEIVETKKRLSEVTQSRAYEEKLELVEEACRNVGIAFSIKDYPEIRQGWNLRNARVIARDRFVKVRTEDRLRLLELLSGSGPSTTYGAAVATLSASGNTNDVVARARVHSLICRRVLAVDLRQPIRLNSALRACAPTTNTIADTFARLRAR